MDSILKHGLDRLPPPAATAPLPWLPSTNICVAGTTTIKETDTTHTHTRQAAHPQAAGPGPGLTEQQQSAELAALSFDERLGLLVDAEWLARENKRLARALQEADFELPQACIEAIDYPARRELDKAVIRQLATCRWIDEHQQVLVTGATGTGKSFIACALGHQACRRGYRAYYRRASRLFDDLRLARADGTYGRLLSKLARMDVLLLDDWGLAPMLDQERRDLLEILEDRYGGRSTIVTRQLTHTTVARSHRPAVPGRCHLRPAPPQRAPDRAKRSFTTKGGQARQLIDRPASLRSVHDPDRRVHDEPIWVFSFAGIRS